MSILTIEGLSKTFGQQKVIDDISFSVEEGRIFGFLGQNGAGKTTTMKMILGLLQADAGKISICGEQVEFGVSKTNRHVGYLPDVPEFYGYMKPMEYLNLCGEITGMSSDTIRNKSKELLELVGLDTVKKRVGGFSRGMKQRLGIAQALINEPKLLICDEPTSALDPVGRKEILEILLSLKARTTVIFSTHILSDVERICDEICVLHQGQLRMQGTLQQLKSSHKKDGLNIAFQNEEEMKRFLESQCVLAMNQDVKINGNSVEIYNTEMNRLYPKVLEVILQSNLSPSKIEIIEPTIENLFMEVVG